MSAVVSVDIQVASTVGNVPSEAAMQSWVQEVINELSVAGDCEVSIRVVDEEEGRELNKQYRDKDQATNVLSFPADEATIASLPADLPQLLGDIVICSPVVEKEASAQRKTTASHWAHLLVHGTLHLLGHDHENDADAEAMEAIETRILRRRGVADPYAA